MDHTVERAMTLGHFLRYLQHQSRNEDNQMQEHSDSTVINKFDYLNIMEYIETRNVNFGELISSTNGPLFLLICNSSTLTQFYCSGHRNQSMKDRLTLSQSPTN